MVNPARIRHRIEKFEMDRDYSNVRMGNIYVDVYVDGKAKWYLSFRPKERKFYLRNQQWNEEDRRRPAIDGRLRDYLVSILPPEIIAWCSALALGVASDEPAIMQKEET